MPKISKQRNKKIMEKKRKAMLLYDEGMTLREVGKVVGYSREWVRQSIIEMTKLDKKNN